MTDIKERFGKALIAEMEDNIRERLSAMPLRERRTYAVVCALTLQVAKALEDDRKEK